MITANTGDLMSQHFEGSETDPLGPLRVMGRFAESVELNPQTQSRDVLLAFYTAGNIVVSLLEQRRSMDRPTARTFLHVMTSMYDQLFDKRLGFVPTDEQVDQLNNAAHDLIANLKDQMVGPAKPIELIDSCFTQYFMTLRPDVKPYDLNVRFYAFSSLAIDGLEVVHDPAAYLKIISTDILRGSTKLLGFDPGSEYAQNLRLLAIPPAQAFMQDN